MQFNARPREPAQLPARAMSRDGVVWSPSEDKWTIPDATRKCVFSWGDLSGLITEQVKLSFKLTITNYLERQSADYARNIYFRMCVFLRRVRGPVPFSAITPDLVLQYRADLAPGTEWQLGLLRGFFQRWTDLGLPGIAPEVGPLLKHMRFKGAQAGIPVLTADPKRGPLTDLEFQAVTVALNDHFAKGNVSVSDYLLIWLFLAIGARPVQMAMLKASDFSVTCASDGATVYILQVPRAKQRASKRRSDFRPRKLIPEVGKLMEQFIAAQWDQWRHLGMTHAEMPLFINPNNTSAVPSLSYHCTGENLSDRMEHISSLLAVHSERTGRLIIAKPRRLRYTRGTRAAIEGASALVIAELLDHSNTQNVWIYVEAVPEIVERIDRAMAMQLAPLAQAFAGQLIDSEAEAVRAGDPNSRIVTPNRMMSPVGNCGSFGFCAALAPIACYTCRNFQPWLNGPHEEVLDGLVAERARLLTETGDVRIASVNDRTILACAAVLQRCAERRSQQEQC